MDGLIGTTIKATDLPRGPNQIKPQISGLIDLSDMLCG